MANLMGHDCTSTHEKVFVIILIHDAVEFRIVALEGKGTDTFCEAGPSEAKVHIGTWVEVFHRDGEHGIGVLRLVLWHHI